MLWRRGVVKWGNFYVGFRLLALVSTGHVGLRVLAYALGGLEKNALLIGVGAIYDFCYGYCLLCNHAFLSGRRVS